MMMSFLLYTVQRRSGVTASEDCPSALHDTPY